MMTERLIEYYMDVARRTSKLSRAQRLQVGCLIVKDGNIISYSWNGTPPGWDNNCEDVLADGSLKTKPEVIHSEANAILKVAKSHESTIGATLFCTHSMCPECAKLVIASGIKEVYYGEDYRDTLGVDMLRKGGVIVTKIG